MTDKESIKAIEIRASIVFNLSFSNNTILSCFFFFFFMIDLYFLIPAMVAQIFNPIAEIVIPTGTQTNDANAEIKTQLVIVEDRISKFSTFKYLHVFLYFCSLNHYVLFYQKENFLFHQFFFI